MWVQSGSAVDVRCSADGNPAPVISVERDNAHISEGGFADGSMTIWEHKRKIDKNDFFVVKMFSACFFQTFSTFRNIFNFFYQRIKCSGYKGQYSVHVWSGWYC